MSSYDTELEQAVFESIVPDLEAEGFRVFVQPSRSVLPPFMRDTSRPDAIALKGDKKIAIEIMSGRLAEGEKLRRLQDLLSAHPEWELRVFYAPPRTAEAPVDAPSKEAIEAILNGLPRIIDEAGPVPAILTAWSALEATARLLMPERIRKPQPPARLVEILASDGYVTPPEADGIRKLSHLWNRAAHGGFDVDFTPVQLEELIRLVRTLLDLSQNAETQTLTQP